MTISPPKSPSSDEIDRKLPWQIVIGVLILASVVFGLGRLAIVNSDRRDAEKSRGDAEAKRGDALQQSLNLLQQRTDRNQEFFEIVRQLLIAQGDEQKKALVDQLRGLQFATTTTTTTTTPTTSVTPTTRPPPPPPPSTTTTTQPPRPPPSPPSTLVCVITPVRNFCT